MAITAVPVTTNFRALMRASELNALAMSISASVAAIELIATGIQRPTGLDTATSSNANPMRDTFGSPGPSGRINRFIQLAQARIRE